MAETVADGTVARKADHVRINLEGDVSAKGVGSGFDEYRFVNCALPEIDLDEVDTSTAMFGRKLGPPILISCMTGGTEESMRINHVLAALEQDRRLAMGLGSALALMARQRALYSFSVRPAAATCPRSNS